MLNKANFNLNEWCSDSYEFMQKWINDADLKNYSFVSTRNSTKILDMFCNPTYCFSISLPKDIHRGPTTKTNVLSTDAQIYDPIGFVAPEVVWAKSICRNSGQQISYIGSGQVLWTIWYNGQV